MRARFRGLGRWHDVRTAGGVRFTFGQGLALGVLPLCASAFTAGRVTAARELTVVERTSKLPPNECPEAHTAQPSPAPSETPPSSTPHTPRRNLEHAPRCADVSVHGIMVADDTRASRSLVSLPGHHVAGRSSEWRVRGDVIGDYRVLHVAGDRVWLARPSAEGYAICQAELGLGVTAPPGPGSPRAVAKPLSVESSRAALPLADLGAKIERRGDGDFLLDRSVVDALVERQGELASLARGGPDVEGGRTVGFRLSVVRPGSILEKLGLQSGDRLRRAANVELTTMESALIALTRVRTSPKFSIELVRDGRVTLIDYETR